MTNSVRFLLILILVWVCSCDRNESVFRDQFRWISGKWEGTHEDRIVCEHWKWNKYRFEGFGFHIKDGDTVFREHLFLEEYHGIPGYSVVFDDHGPFSFALIQSDDRVHVFENKDHDFPSKVIYSFENDSSMTIRLLARENPENGEISYQLNRKK